MSGSSSLSDLLLTALLHGGLALVLPGLLALLPVGPQSEAEVNWFCFATHSQTQFLVEEVGASFRSSQFVLGQRPDSYRSSWENKKTSIEEAPSRGEVLVNRRVGLTEPSAQPNCCQLRQICRYTGAGAAHTGI